jgi:hypothetical protein
MTMAEAGIEVGGGRMPWRAAIEEHLRDAHCLWQDLDGLHLSGVPAEAPHTTLLHAWTAARLVRVRLDRDSEGVWAHVAVVDRPPAAERLRHAEVRPWQEHDGRIAGFHRQREAEPERAALPASLRSVVVDGIGDGAGPVTFIYVP